MGLREISGNERRSPPPLNSPLARQIRGGRKRGLDLRKTSFEASQYIEHIENELQQVKEAMHSPKSGRPLQEKVKTLKLENKQLKQIIKEFEDSFEGRVKEAIEHKTTVEVELRRKVKALEDEIVFKDGRIRDLEYHTNQSSNDRGCIEALKATIEMLELDKQGLEDSSRGIERRNDVLTELLAQSPARIQHGFTLASPIRDSRRTPRPKSMMMPRILTSPHTDRSSRPQSAQTSPAHSTPSCYFSPRTALIQEHSHPCDDSEVVTVQRTLDSQSLDSGLGESCSIQSPTEAYSKRSSTVSQTSISPSAWGLPLPVSPPDQKAATRQHRHRKTRRFESGSTQLKPLLLPAIAAEKSLSQLGPSTPPSPSPVHRDFSEQSFDPTVSFLSQPFETPTQPKRRSSTWASEEALKALEGTSGSRFESFEDILASHEAITSGQASYPRRHELSEYVQRQGHEVKTPPSQLGQVHEEGDATAFVDSPRSLSTDEQSISSTVAQASIIEANIQTEAGDDLEIKAPDSEAGFSVVPDCRLKSHIADTDPYTYLPALQDSLTTFEMPIHGSFSNSTIPRKSIAHFAAPSCGNHVDAPQTTLNTSSVPLKRRRSSTPIDISALSPTPRPRSVERRCVSTPHRDSLSLPSPSKEPKASHKEDHHMNNNGFRSPLEILQRKGTSSSGLTSVTIRTIFGTLSRYTSYMREIRRDPTALARRVIANAWCSNWKRLGKFSWWVLGLFLGPHAKKEQAKALSDAGWNWEDYDGEEIAQRVCGPGPSILSPSGEDFIQSDQNTEHGDKKTVRFDQPLDAYQTGGTKSRANSALKRDPPCSKKTTWGRSLFLWRKFSVAIMLAVGGAIISGPGEMLKECDNHEPRYLSGNSPPTRPERSDPGFSDSNGQETDVDEPTQIDENDFIGGHGDDLQSYPREALDQPLSFLKLRPTSSKRDSASTRPRKHDTEPSVIAKNPCTSGTPRRSENWDMLDDKRKEKAVKSIDRMDDPSLGGDQLISFGYDTPDPDQGTLQWMQTLRLSEFESIQGEKTAIKPYNGGTRPRSLAS